MTFFLLTGHTAYDIGLVNVDFFLPFIRPATSAELKQSWPTTLGLIVRAVRQWALGVVALAFLGGLLGAVASKPGQARDAHLAVDWLRAVPGILLCHLHRR